MGAQAPGRQRARPPRPWSWAWPPRSTACERERTFATSLTKANIALDQQRQRAEAREQQAIDAVKRFRDAVAENPELKNNPLTGTAPQDPAEGATGLLPHPPQPASGRQRYPPRIARPAGRRQPSSWANLSDEIGDEQDAIAAYREALSIRQKLADTYPDVPEYQSDLASSHAKLGRVLSHTGQTAEGETRSMRWPWRCASGSPKPIRPTTSTRATWRRATPTSENCWLDSGQPAEAMKLYDAAEVIYRKLAASDPNNAKFLSDLAANLHNGAMNLESQGQRAEALARYQEARKFQEKAVASDPTVARYRQFLANTLGCIGSLLSNSGRSVEALEPARASATILQELVESHPSNNQVQSRACELPTRDRVDAQQTGRPDACPEVLRVVRESLGNSASPISRFLIIRVGWLGVTS